QAFISTARGKGEMDAIRQLVTAMEQEEQGLLRARTQESRRLFVTALVLLAFATLLGLGLVALAFSLFRRDLTARERAAVVLHEQRERFRTTLASIGDAVIVTDAHGVVTFLNGVAQALTGWRDEAVGKKLDDVFRIVNEKTHQPVENPADRAIHEGTVVGLANHTLLIARDGKELPTDDRAAPIRDAKGGVVGVVLIFRDITARRRDEQSLRAAREQLQVVTDSMSALVTRCSRELRYLWVSKAMADWIGRPAEEIIGRPILDALGP